MKWPTYNSHSFPLSWFFKSKQKGDPKNTEFAPQQGRFYSMDEDDFFWRLSFGDETIHARKSTGGINPLRREFDREEGRNFNDMVSDIKKMRESRGKQMIVKTEEFGIQTSRKFMGFEDEDEKIPPLQERFSNSVSDWLEIEGRKLKELKIKSESRKKLTKGINKSISPRTECKVRALEEKKKKRKKSRSKTKKKREQVLEENAIFDSFAVVKSSYNPQQDFRESMLEMIRERGIQSAQDLQQLLACYLTMNCDEYHDLIIKVFRQVWFELKNGSYFDHRIH